jgi:hypothetical protein
MNKMTKHQEKCSSPICMDCKDETTIWYPGESICKKLPVSDIQFKQKRINSVFKRGKLKNSDCPYTYLYLKTHSF